jgi:type VI secretion system secreted protein Hcp
MALNAYLKLDAGFEGESTSRDHPDEIEIESWSWGASNPATLVSGGGSTSGKVSFQDISFTNATHKSSPLLMKACATGQHIKKAVLSVRKAGGSSFDYIKITMEDVLVSSFQQAGDTGGDSPSEQLSLNFAKIEFSYTTTKADGKPGDEFVAGYDLKLQKSL